MLTSETRTPLDVWLVIPEGQEESEYEANTFLDEDMRFRVEWYHVDVGVVSHRIFDTYEEAKAWLESEEFEDYSS
jgi:hypothetical protein